MNGYTTGEPNKGIPCPHSDGKSTIVCWDCVENGYAGRGGGVPPSPEDFEKETFVGLDDSPLEVHPPAEGLEVGALDPRQLYPGLEAISGPVIVKDPRSWSAESKHKAVLPPTILGLRRRVFWIILIGLLVVLLIGVAIGAAVGVVQSKHSSNNTQSAIASPTPSPASPATSSVTSSEISLAISSEAASSSISSSSSIRLASILSTSSTLAVSKTSSSTSSATSKTSSTTALVTAGGDKKSTTPSPTPTQPAPTPTTATATTTVLVTPPVTTPTPTPTPTPTSPKTTPTPTPTTTIKPTSVTTAKPTTSLVTPAQSNGYCLGPDGSTYADPGTGSRFRVECDVAHQGKDIENLEADTMEDCVSLCADNSRCVGAIWYNVGPQGTDLNYCWLKSSLDDGDIRDTPDAQSVVRL